jgi:NAD(P)-dependent dehydrogenase (short-subunit alcohol dehydrogenase family)
MVLQKSSS